jgi:UDP-galactopyranose mutase
MNNLCTKNIIIVGSGLSGCVIANLFASKNKKVLIIEKRNHIGGNCYDYIDPETNILISKYGAHLFHTNNERVWNYIQQFSEWIRWDHKVLSHINNQLVPIPVNIETVNHLFNLNLQSSEDVENWFASKREIKNEYKNSEEIAKSRVGSELYELMFKNYTIKQWDKSPSELEPEVLARIPIRDNWDGRYFTDKYQALPKEGYTKMIEKMIDSENIEVQLNTDYDDIKNNLNSDHIVIFTGRIDSYFSNHNLPPLEYRSLNFEWKTYPELNGFYQPNSVINYPSDSVPFTRIVEYKHFYDQHYSNKRKVKGTIISFETSCSEGEPYYPVPTKENRELYSKYQNLVLEEQKIKNVHFIGRLASYKYFNMDAAILNALEYFDTHFKN